LFIRLGTISIIKSEIKSRKGRIKGILCFTSYRQEEKKKNSRGRNYAMDREKKSFNFLFLGTYRNLDPLLVQQIKRYPLRV